MAGVAGEGAVVLERVGMRRILGVQLVEQLECAVQPRLFHLAGIA